MIVIFCADPLDARQVDSMYQPEADAVRSLAVDYTLIDFEALSAGRFQQAVKRVPTSESPHNTDAVYRGWMLKPPIYAGLYGALLERGIRLMNDATKYQHAHHLPESYAIIEPYTPKSVWLPVTAEFTMEAVHAALTVFDDNPVMVKDYVKSQKHYWHEACFIPDASDRQSVERVVSRFLELQGDDLNEGLVFRAFVEFEPLSQHSVSGMPLTREYRVFVMDGQPIFSTKYWSEGEYADLLPELSTFSDVMKQVDSRFYTMDIARRLDGTWMIVELGDGQVAGLPDHVDVIAFYRAMLNQHD